MMNEVTPCIYINHIKSETNQILFKGGLRYGVGGFRNVLDNVRELLSCVVEVAAEHDNLPLFRSMNLR